MVLVLGGSACCSRAVLVLLALLPACPRQWAVSQGSRRSISLKLGHPSTKRQCSCYRGNGSPGVLPAAPLSFCRASWWLLPGPFPQAVPSYAYLWSICVHRPENACLLWSVATLLPVHPPPRSACRIDDPRPVAACVSCLRCLSSAGSQRTCSIARPPRRRVPSTTPRTAPHAGCCLSWSWSPRPVRLGPVCSHRPHPRRPPCPCRPVKGGCHS